MSAGSDQKLATDTPITTERSLTSIQGKDAMNPKVETSTSGSGARLSCTTCFDSLWFCYSPVHQMQQYYRLGVLDNCSEKWNALFDCFNLKTKRSSEMQCRKFWKLVRKPNLTFGLFAQQKKHHLIGKSCSAI
uniref:Uncharacterized protein n=1 Tax=Nelumbo nucifera TaxID=4432 RepID=A0A822ZUN5_NELNU|nr:TPA_asm: hypothetical protein HUJ06_018620 [Nelumbo nucifera]